MATPTIPGVPVDTPVSSTPNSGAVGSAQTQTPVPTKGQVIDTVLHDVIYFGTLAASVFVKNPASQAKASTILQALGPLLQLLDPQIQSIK